MWLVIAANQPVPAEEEPDVRIVKRAFEAFARRDVEQALELIHPHARLWVVTAAVTRGGRPYVGHDGMREYFADTNRLWQELTLVPSEFDAVGTSIVVLGEVRARGAAGELRQPAVWTWKLRDGLVIDCRVDSDVSVARDALGEATTIEGIVRDYIDAFNRRDTDAMIALSDPAIVNYPTAISRRGRSYTGHDGLRDWMRDVLEHDHGYTIRAREIRRLESDRWAVLGELVIDAQSLSAFASLIGVSGGLITDAHEYLSEESLLQELGHLPVEPG